MKYRIFGITIFLIIGLIIIYIITIPKVEKWSYNLPNEYVIRKVSDVEVILEKNKQIMIQDYIAEFSYSDNYIGLKCIKPDNGNFIVNFYIIHGFNNKIYGPYEIESEYNQEIDKKTNEQLSDWIKTINVPDGAIISR